MDALFECTLEMVSKNLEDYPEHRTNFFRMLQSVTQHCFPGENGGAVSRKGRKREGGMVEEKGHDASLQQYAIRVFTVCTTCMYVCSRGKRDTLSIVPCMHDNYIYIA